MAMSEQLRLVSPMKHGNPFNSGRYLGLIGPLSSEPINIPVPFSKKQF
jgi:hypothetical protein